MHINNHPTPPDWSGIANADIVMGSGDDPSLRGFNPSVSRHLADQRHNADGTLAVLMIVFALFCFIWAPVMLRRCRAPNNGGGEVHDLARFEAEARAVRATLQRMSMMNNHVVEETVSSESRDPHLQHRKEFLDNALLTKKVIFQSKFDEEEDKEDDVIEALDDSISLPEANDRKPPKRQKSNVIVLVNTSKHKVENATNSSYQDTEEENAIKNEEKDDDTEIKSIQEQDGHDSQQSAPADESQLEPCSICLTEYHNGDDICWSHNDKCHHFFHKACIQTWLLTHEECPCCRQNFLCLWGDEDDQASHYRRDYIRSVSTSSLDWAEELAEEIQQRILQRQRELQAELRRRDRRQQMLQSHQRLHSASTPALPPTQRQGAFPARNTVISVDDMAAGFLLYRHFPMQFASDPRRLARGTLERERTNTADDEDVQVAHFGVSSGLQRIQTYRPDQPVLAGTAPGSRIFEMVDRSSRRHLRPSDHLHTRPSFLSSSGRQYTSGLSARDRRSSTQSTNGRNTQASSSSNVRPSEASAGSSADRDEEDDGVVTASA